METNKKFYIFNYWWAANYGACLTGFAINKLIKNSYLVNNEEYVQKLRESNFSFHRNFAKKYLKTVDKSRDLINKDNCIYVTGSDQVFRPSINKKVASDYFLNFAKPSCKKIAFSASFGLDKERFLEENSKETIEKIKTYLDSFDFISVREKSGIEICKDLFDTKAELIIDPVFIIDKSKYEELLNNATKDYSDKIVSYMINDSLCEYKGEKTVELFASNMPVENWLNAIKTCKLFITNSFHGVCFAIIFNKPFICIINSEHGSARYDSLFEMLGMENKCINSADKITDTCIFSSDYEEINQNICKEKQKGLIFLKKITESSVDKIEKKMNIRCSYLEEEIYKLEEKTNLKYQIKNGLKCFWLIIWIKFLPKQLKFIINLFRNKHV